MKKRLYLLVLIAIAICLVGCKKKETLPTYGKEFSITCERPSTYTEGDEGKYKITTTTTLYYDKDGFNTKRTDKYFYEFYDEEKFNEYKGFAKDIEEQNNKNQVIELDEENKSLIYTTTDKIRHKSDIDKKEYHVTEIVKTIKEDNMECTYDNITLEELENSK